MGYTEHLMARAEVKHHSDGAEQCLGDRDQVTAGAEAPPWLQGVGDPQELAGHQSYQSQGRGEDEQQLRGQAGGFILGREGT